LDGTLLANILAIDPSPFSIFHDNLTALRSGRVVGYDNNFSSVPTVRIYSLEVRSGR
jgi:hypothetical protein